MRNFSYILSMKYFSYLRLIIYFIKIIFKILTLLKLPVKNNKTETFRSRSTPRSYVAERLRADHFTCREFRNR